MTIYSTTQMTGGRIWRGADWLPAMAPSAKPIPGVILFHLD